MLAEAASLKLKAPKYVARRSAASTTSRFAARRASSRQDAPFHGGTRLSVPSAKHARVVGLYHGESFVRLLVTLALIIAAPVLALAMPRSDTVAVIGAPWAGAERMMAIVADADGSPVRGGAQANVMVAHSSRPGFVRRLYAAGAWLVLDQSFILPCLTSTLRKTS
jgi:hypothetical protein